MIKLAHLVGARPQFIKAGAICRALNEGYANRFQQTLIHTGQHYDTSMSEVFFKDLDIPMPDTNLEVGSGSHAVQTARIMERLEPVLRSLQPDVILLYGDTNSTLAGAVVASKMGIPIAHIEAGMRSFNHAMPEEINRVLTDHASTFLYCPSQESVKNLAREGLIHHDDPSIGKPVVEMVGDVMYDNCRFIQNNVGRRETDIPYALMTIHRNYNTDDPERLSAILDTVDRTFFSLGWKVRFPIHPRTEKVIPARDWKSIELVQPLGFSEMASLIMGSRMVITDSGGLQKEAYYFERPIVLLREETEWIEIFETGAGVMVGADPERLEKAIREFSSHPPQLFPPLYGKGNSSALILESLSKYLSR
ncbi:MAG: UDP-N-acetylglucosamine 2-epimerase (non-hydrolyzing) [Bacteroidota bacterium]|nr:UDP-N-acetylglucosamine 2-epimerase (non-hydrolyzing) [Bacteroidota bacterium]MDX5427461.1 UDP-N-acetylglucosamine 2-epimerase (non-hydrolyzing) [Bacteroidota bacterium]MDX5448442.1 UDP-N-acetylglucosamine 2-epimerase (non-hydrolyzing) [Bacteroidota bacterium]MDX5505399.1 UDP-N-acetylglucosamine 2-epimerase (non-hydrolyzing) [Bacteroidota bacterium]